MTAAEIEAAIPHRPPMRLLDEIVSQEATKIVCRKTFAHDEFFVQGHFPDLPIVPGVILCECCLQAGAILLSRHGLGDTAVPVATRLDGVKFKQMVRPGDTVEVEATLKDQLAGAFYLTGRLRLRGRLAARLDFACSVVPRNPDPEEASR